MNPRDNILAAFARVDIVDFQEGLQAYRMYRCTLKRLGTFYGFPLGPTVAAFCPNNDYMGNLRSCATVLRGVAEGWQDEEITVTTYKACRDRALRFVRGEDFLATTKGKKTRAFFRNIMDPNDPDPVTIDGHMVGVWKGRQMTMKEAVESVFNYDTVAADFRAVARSQRLIPNQLQAMLWFTWKRIHDVKAVHQLSLLRPRDQWLLDVEPERIRTFPRRGVDFLREAR